MYLKKLRNDRVALVESRYVRKGVAGNTHGYSRAVILCSLPALATSLLSDVAELLTEEQLRYLEDKLLVPNRRREADARAVAEARASDPGWRLLEAARLVSEARELCLHKTVNTAAILAVRDAIDALDPQYQREGLVIQQPLDPMTAAIQAVNAATGAVERGHYGMAPEVGVRESPVYHAWQQLNEAVSGSGGSSLQRVLQKNGWVKTKRSSQ